MRPFSYFRVGGFETFASSQDDGVAFRQDRPEKKPCSELLEEDSTRRPL